MEIKSRKEIVKQIMADKDGGKQVAVALKVVKSRWEIFASILQSSFKWVALIFFLSFAFGVAGDLEPQVESRFMDWLGQSVDEKSGRDIVAVVPIVGMIAGENSGFLDFLPVEKVLQMLDQIENDERVKAVVLKIDSPGGTVFDTERLVAKIMQLKARKKVFALLQSTAASGGFLVATCAERIFADPETLTGSVGVVAEFPNFTGLMESAGVEMIAISSGKMKTAGSPFQDFPESQRKIFQQIVAESHQNFVASVASNRGLEVGEVERLADGRIFTGRQAVELGLIDSIGGTFDLQNELKNLQLENANLLEFHLPQSPFASLTRPLGKFFARFASRQNSLPVVLFF